MLFRAPMPSIDWRSLGKPFHRQPFFAFAVVRLLVSFSNGLTQTMQDTFPNKVLQVSLLRCLPCKPACAWVSWA